ncbi:hypothetical protein Tco_1157952 [Tanacetum coccineum]
MSTANQKTLAELGASNRPSILEKGSYVPWASRFMRFLENKQEEGELMRSSIDNGPYIRQDILDPNNNSKTILEPISKMTSQNKAQYFANIKVMNYILQGIPNDIYNSVDACLDDQQMWKRIKRLMQGSEISQQERHSRLMNEFDKFVPNEGESLTSMYERCSTLINVMDWNEVHPPAITINTKFLNSLQPKWSKYVTMTQKKGVRNHDPLALVSNSYAHSSHSHASPSYSYLPQPYYVTHPSSMVDNDDDYQGEIQRDAQEDKLTTTMMLLARAITQRYSTHTNNHLCTSSNTMNQAVIQDGRMDIQSKNVGYAGNGNRNVERQNKNQATNAGNGLVHSIEEYDQNVKRIPKTKSTLEKTNMLLTLKDEAEAHLDEEENSFMLDNAYVNNILEELNTVVIMMAHIQPTDDKSDAKPTYDSEFISEKLETIMHTSVDDQIDSDIIFDDPYMDNNSGQAEHDTNAHDQSLHDFESLITNV